MTSICAFYYVYPVNQSERIAFNRLGILQTIDLLIFRYIISLLSQKFAYNLQTLILHVGWLQGPLI